VSRGQVLTLDMFLAPSRQKAELQPIALYVWREGG